MDEYGQIVEIKGEDAIILIKRSSACAKCGACQIASSEYDDMYLTTPNKLGGQVGDHVKLELASSQVIKASAIAYLLPLLALILGIVVGYLLAPKFGFEPELFGAILGIVLTLISFICIHALEPVFKKESTFSPQIIDIKKPVMEGEKNNGK